MSRDVSLRDAEQVQALAEKFQEVLAVRKLDKSGEPAAYTLAHGLADIAQSCGSLLNEHLPALVEADSAEAFDILIDIGEELRHIRYHMDDIQFFNYLKEP